MRQTPIWNIRFNKDISIEQRWNYLLGIPMRGCFKGLDGYSVFRDGENCSHFMTGSFGFSGWWRAGRAPNDHLDEVMAFAYEPCDVKEKWKRMVIWNCLFERPRKDLKRTVKTTKSERERYVVSKLLEIFPTHNCALNKEIKNL